VALELVSISIFSKTKGFSTEILSLWIVRIVSLPEFAIRAVTYNHTLKQMSTRHGNNIFLSTPRPWFRFTVMTASKPRASVTWSWIGTREHTLAQLVLIAMFFLVASRNVRSNMVVERLGQKTLDIVVVADDESNVRVYTQRELAA
jgi:hypothetical protein